MIPNLRDVGGCSTASGRLVARGAIYRSGAFSCTADSPAHAVLESLGIRRVIDLRSPGEVEEAGEIGLPPSVQRIHQPFLPSIENRRFQPSERSARATGERYHEYLLEGRASVAAVLAELSSARSRPTLVHCFAGRDRTGIVISCLLSLLGVPDDVIARDYAESSVVDDPEWGDANPENILHFLEIVRERHGGVASLMASGQVGEAPLDGIGNLLLDA